MHSSRRTRKTRLATPDYRIGTPVRQARNGPFQQSEDPAHFGTLRRLHQLGLYEAHNSSEKAYTLPQNYSYLEHEISVDRFMRGMTEPKQPAWKNIQSADQRMYSVYERGLNKICNPRLRPVHPETKLRLLNKYPIRKTGSFTARTHSENEKERVKQGSRSKPQNPVRATRPVPPTFHECDRERFGQLDTDIDVSHVNRVLAPPSHGHSYQSTSARVVVEGHLAEAEDLLYKDYPYVNMLSPRLPKLRRFYNPDLATTSVLVDRLKSPDLSNKRHHIELEYKTKKCTLFTLVKPLHPYVVKKVIHGLEAKGWLTPDELQFLADRFEEFLLLYFTMCSEMRMSASKMVDVSRFLRLCSDCGFVDNVTLTHVDLENLRLLQCTMDDNRFEAKISHLVQKGKLPSEIKRIREREMEKNPEHMLDLEEYLELVIKAFKIKYSHPECKVVDEPWAKKWEHLWTHSLGPDKHPEFDIVRNIRDFFANRVEVQGWLTDPEYNRVNKMYAIFKKVSDNNTGRATLPQIQKHLMPKLSHGKTVITIMKLHRAFAWSLNENMYLWYRDLSLGFPEFLEFLVRIADMTMAEGHIESDSAEELVENLENWNEAVFSFLDPESLHDVCSEVDIVNPHVKLKSRVATKELVVCVHVPTDKYDTLPQDDQTSHDHIIAQADARDGRKFKEEEEEEEEEDIDAAIAIAEAEAEAEAHGLGSPINPTEF